MTSMESGNLYPMGERLQCLFSGMMGCVDKEEGSVDSLILRTGKLWEEKQNKKKTGRSWD